jgi:hypothetical protein
MATVNLRAVGSDPQFPTRGPLIGTAEVPDGPSPLLLVTPYDEQSNLRLFVLVPHSDGLPHGSEYIETIPTSVSVQSRRRCARTDRRRRQ